MEPVALIKLIGGLTYLLFAGELLVRGALALARKAHISPMVVGLTVVAFGTSAPELFVAVSAALQHLFMLGQTRVKYSLFTWRRITGAQGFKHFVHARFKLVDIRKSGDVISGKMGFRGGAAVQHDRRTAAQKGRENFYQQGKAVAFMRTLFAGAA